MQDIFTVNAIASDLFSIEENGTHCFLLTGTEAALLIDTGRGGGDLKAAVKSLTNLPVIVVNTHSDPDHTGNNKQFERIYLHPSEFSVYRKRYGNDDILVPMWENDFIDIGGGRLEVLLVPGHTPGSIALLDIANRILFAGDTISDSRVFMFGEERNMEAYVYSLEKLTCRSDFDTAYCAHGTAEVSADKVKLLAKGARQVLEGRLEGTADPKFGENVKIYNAGTAKILYR